MIDPNTLADEIVAYTDTDDLAKLPHGDADALRAAFWYPDWYDFADIIGTPEVNAGLLSMLREAQRVKGVGDGGYYRDVCAGLVNALLTHAHAMSDSLAEQALRDAYDRAHPDNSTEADDMRQRARDLRATA